MDRECASAIIEGYINNDLVDDLSKEAFRMAKKSLAVDEIYQLMYDKWIPVTEGLPKEHSRVIFSTEYASYYGTYHDDSFYNEFGKRSLIGVTAWMYMPEAFKVN